MSKSINTLTRQLRDLNSDTRSKAAMNLGEMGAEEAVPSIISAFKSEENEDVRSVFAETFALFGHMDSVVKTLISAKLNKTMNFLRRMAGCGDALGANRHRHCL